MILRYIFFTFFFTLSLPSITIAAEWIPATVNTKGGPIYKEPNLSSQLLGTYPVGTTLRVYSEARGGFYAIYFSQPWNGVQYAWIPIESINTQVTSSSQHNRSHRNLASEKATSAEYYENAILATGSFFVFNPTDLQSFISAQSQSFLSIGFDLEYARRFSRELGASIRFGYFNFTQPLSSTSNSTINYSASGFSMILSLSYFFITTHNFSLQLDAGAGGSINSIGNKTNYFQSTTGEILGLPITASIDSSFRIADSFSLFLRLGYEFQTLNSVYLLIPPTGTSVGTTSVTFNAPFASVGLGLLF